jgi:ribosomal protein S18 acetylase RimI-like enzyme
MKKALTFRFAASHDFSDVLELACQLARQIEAPLPLLTAAQFEAHYTSLDAPMRLLVALRENQVVGMISWTITHELYSAEARVYISDVSVHHAFRGEGIGTALMAEVETWARAHNASKLAWEVWHRNFAAKRFYEGLGASHDEEALPYILVLKDYQV